MGATEPAPLPGRLCILGAGGHAKVCYEAALAQGWAIAAVASPAPAPPDAFDGLAVLADEQTLHGRLPAEVQWFLGIGDLAVRTRLRRTAAELGRAMGLVIHPSAIVSPSARLAPGVLIAPRAVVNPAARIGADAIVNTGAIVEHDCEVGENCHIAPGAVLCGGVRMGDDVMIGAGSVVLPNVTIGPGAVIGAGGVVVRDVPAGGRVVGSPARDLRVRTP